MKSSILLTALILATPVLSYGADNTKRAGDVGAVGLPLIAAGLSLYYNDKDGLGQLVKSEAATLVIVEALKATVHERRPDGSDNKSFPSGHAAVAFSAAQYLQMRGGWQLGVPAYAVATFVGYSRVHSNQHYWRDVIAGSAIGMGSTYYFTDTPVGLRRGLSLTTGPNKTLGVQYSSLW